MLITFVRLKEVKGIYFGNYLVTCEYNSKYIKIGKTKYLARFTSHFQSFSF